MSNNIVERKKSVTRILSLCDGKVLKCIKEPQGEHYLDGFYAEKFYVMRPTNTPARVEILGSKTQMYSSVLPKEIYDNALKVMAKTSPMILDQYFKEVPVGEFLDSVSQDW
jgi:hypothetical protein